MAKSRAELLELFRKTAGEIVEREFPTLTEDTKIAELGIDSLGMLEVISALERELTVQIPDEALAGLVTIRDFIDAVEKRFAV